MYQSESSSYEKDNYNKIFHKYYESAIKYIYYKCGDMALAEDIVQNVFIKLWKQRVFISYSKAKPYIYKACNNLLINEITHKKVVLRYTNTLQKGKDIETPEFIMETKEFAKQVQKAIANLPDKEREVFLLSRIDKKTYREIAEITNITVKAVERRISKALFYLREYLNTNIKF